MPNIIITLISSLTYHFLQSPCTLCEIDFEERCPCSWDRYCSELRGRRPVAAMSSRPHDCFAQRLWWVPSSNDRRTKLTIYIYIGLYKITWLLCAFSLVVDRDLFNKYIPFFRVDCSVIDAQMTSQRGKNKKVAHEPPGGVGHWCSYHVVTSSVHL